MNDAMSAKQTQAEQKIRIKSGELPKAAGADAL